MNIPRDGKCSHANNPHPLLCISTSAETSNSIKVNVPDQWNQLGRRMISALPEIAAKYHADWLFKLDPDTTVYPSRLEAALNVLPPDVLYVGQVYSFEGRTYASGGAGYGIRGDVLQKFNTSQCELIPSESANYEDVTVGNCLQKNGANVQQLDGLYGDDLFTSSNLARKTSIFENHIFPVNLSCPLLTIHKSHAFCNAYTALECLQNEVSAIPTQE